MAKRIILISSLPVLNKVFSFFVAFLFIIIAGCSSPNYVQLSAEDEYKAQKTLLRLQSSVDDEDYMKAQLVLSSFQRDYSNTTFYKEHSKKISEFARQIKKDTKNMNIEDKIEYLFAPPRLQTKLWKEYMSSAERIISQNQGRMAIAVLRVIFEDEDNEIPSVRVERDSTNELYVLFKDGGYSNTKDFQSGEPVFIGSGFWRYRTSDSNDKNVSAVGNIAIGGLYHYPIKLKIEVQKGKVIAFGEIFVRSIPEEYRGNLKVKVETEEGTKLTDAGVILKASGFYLGKTQFLKDGSCLFSSVGPGTYCVEIASNNTFGSSSQPAEVVLGQTTEVTINAYRHRMIEFDWRFRNSKEPDKWLSGRNTIKTKEYWQPGEAWGQEYCQVIAFGDWKDNTCMIRRQNGDLMLVNTDEPFEDMNFPSSFVPSYRDYPIKEGDIFAWRQAGRKESILEALIRIGKITPVGISEE